MRTHPIRLGPLGSTQESQARFRDGYGRFRDDIGEQQTRSHAPCFPFRTVSYSLGGQGTRRGSLPSRRSTRSRRGALSSRGILARKWAWMRPVFGKAPDGAAEKVRSELAWARTEPSLPPFSSRRQPHHRARNRDRSDIPSGIFSRGKEREQSRMARSAHHGRGKVWIWAFSRIRRPIPRLAGPALHQSGDRCEGDRDTAVA